MALITREDIIKAAFRVWGRELYLATSLRDLAGELGVSKAALYRHFRNKEAILDAMYEHFFDDFTAFVKDEYDRARGAAHYRESAGIFSRSIIEYYARNRDAFIFSLMQVFDNRKLGDTGEALRRRGMDIDWFWLHAEPNRNHPPLFQMSLATLMFWVAVFHNRDQPVKGKLNEKNPTEAEIQALISRLEEIITRGMGLQKERVDALDYGSLEKNIPRSQMDAFEDGDLLKAVAETVAEAGPWDASLDMIARRSGLSKSGLYAHFRNKQDMLKRFFVTEFERMIRYAEEGIAASTVPSEQFYLALVSLADYLRSRQEILMAADWIRTRRIDLGLEIPPRMYRVFRPPGFPAPGRCQMGGGGGGEDPEVEFGPPG
ncbi:MAG: TetR/AcrR family transcriptional regulator, partial [Treponema sp.]|nr:TetR/AcrR family transcriptional regulator [Treponema sp.]